MEQLKVVAEEGLRARKKNEKKIKKMKKSIDNKCGVVVMCFHNHKN